MKKERKHPIMAVNPDGIGAEMGLEVGDCLLRINGQAVEDIFDYRFLLREEEVLVEVEKQDGELWELEIEKDAEEDLGIEFGDGLMDRYRSCANRCIFCFIDQMPPGMRDTLYFKDDDARLSFLQGNYVTLTNMSRHDIDRIIRYRLEPINISFQAMEPSLRCKMLNNRQAGASLEKARLLYEAGIRMNGQIVLCKGINDGEHLEESIRSLAEYAPVLESVSIVPVGLTRFREGLPKLLPFNREDAGKLLDQVDKWQQKMLCRCGLHFVHASDEWYILAGRPLPEEESYDGYLQYENGVGMLRLLEEEFTAALRETNPDDRILHATLATGMLAAPFLEKHMAALKEKFKGINVQVKAVPNRFFGESITVSGLVTGQDLVAALVGQELGEKLLIPCNMLRSQEDVFLDDMHLDQVEEILGIPVVAVEESGEDLLRAVLDPPTGNSRRRRQNYEQTDRGDRWKA